MTAFHFPALEAVGARLIVDSNLHLERVDLPALTKTRGAVQLTDNAGTSVITAPLLQQSGGLSVQRKGALASLNLHALSTSNGALYVEGNPALRGIIAPLLEYVSQNFAVENQPLLATLSLPALRRVNGYPQRLSFAIRNNPHLPECRALTLFAQLTLFVGLSEVANNDVAATCQ